ncbi:DUF2975 domain-containing protein [Tumebacillus sp. ITR2]|uniref:DUF2975 domain-containing protein n=1 Tax=Tumebacillus amylolyticus TaxID=2801339 RepID=A0ABS1J9F6_9BACL|nr:DUF2975 domain-containing protein [Tumebacillus amylolyticus]MBL0386903.1 DUF2975 domain-containing protein [Tumebacillus amylolyticus]
MKRETIFLKLAVVLMAIPVLALCIFALPEVASGATEQDSELAYLQISAVVAMYGTAIAYFVALYQAFRLLRYIDKNNAFSELSVRALKNIKNCAITISVFFVAALPFLFHVAQEEDAPGLGALGLIIIFGAIVVAVFAAVLQKLLQNAIDIKSENELTV